MTTRTFALPIVGAKFRPPALGILATLPSDCALVLRREPSNGFDVNAIQVLVARSALERLDARVLNEAVLGYGSSFGDLMLSAEHHLGYIPREDAARLAPLVDARGLVEWSGALGFSPTGAPRVEFTLEEED